MDLVGSAEIAQRLDITQTRVNQLALASADFPEPVATLSAGRVWEWAHVERWARATGRLSPSG